MLTNQHRWHILFLCTVSKLCFHSPRGQIVMFKWPSLNVSQKVIIKYVPFSLFRFCTVFAVYVINSLWSLNYCLESKGFWKICHLSYGYDACLTFPQTWSVMEGVNGGPRLDVGSELLIGNACAPHCWKLYLKNRKIPQHYLTLKKVLTRTNFAGGYLN